MENKTTFNFDEKNFITFKTRENKEIDLTEYYDLIYEYKNDCLVAGIKYNKTYYKKAFGVNNVNIDLANNLKSLSITNEKIDSNQDELNLLMSPYISICNTIVDIILNSKSQVDFSNLRQILYDILVYNLNIHDCIFYILKCLINHKKIQNNQITNESILENTLIFFKYFNNNYRPIYHLENYILYLIKTTHEL